MEVHMKEKEVEGEGACRWLIHKELVKDLRQVEPWNVMAIDKVKQYLIYSGPNRLISATGGGAPSFTFVCPQYAITYFDGCQVTVGAGARAGTRCIGMPVSVAHCKIQCQR